MSHFRHNETTELDHSSGWAPGVERSHGWVIITSGLAGGWLMMAHLDTGHQPQALAWELCTGSQEPANLLSLHTAHFSFRAADNPHESLLGNMSLMIC